MADRRERQIKTGVPDRLGVTRRDGGCNFAVEVPWGKEASLLLYRRKESEPELEIDLNETFRVGNVAAVFLPGFTGNGYEYNYRIDGAVVPDPYACKITGRRSFGEFPTADPCGIRSGFWDGSEKIFEGDVHPQIPYEDMILYKVHVRGYTKSPRLRGKYKGTFRGLQEKIPYLQELGVNSLELMPAYEFGEISQPIGLENEAMIRVRREPERVNYWGYTGGYYFAPKAAYAVSANPIQEFQNLVHSLHRVGIELIMEFYFPKEVHPVTVLDVLHFWRRFYRVDGFHLLGEGARPDLILQDPLLARTKLIVSGFDTGDAYFRGKPEYRNVAVSHFGFEQTMRRILKSDEDMLPGMLSYIRENPAEHGVIHYMASQDGFTMMDLVSYDYRHNEENGENNRDGTSYNYSWNCGVEGPTRRRSVRQLRLQQIRNAFLLLLLSQGTPMIYGGDEFGNSQEGNNNAYCQDNPIGWVDWGAFRKNDKILDFVKAAIAFRKGHPVLHSAQPLQGSDYRSYGFPDISCHGQRAWYCNMENTSRSVGVLYYGKYAEGEPAKFLYVAYNFHWEEQEFALPNVPEEVQWYLAADTSDLEGAGFYPEGEEIAVQERRIFVVKPRRILILIGK